MHHSGSDSDRDKSTGKYGPEGSQLPSNRSNRDFANAPANGANRSSLPSGQISDRLVRGESSDKTQIFGQAAENSLQVGSKKQAGYPTTSFSEQPFQPRSVGRTAVAWAFAIGMLPVLAAGTATYYFGNRAIDRQSIRARQAGIGGLTEAVLAEERQLLSTLSLGTGVTALLAGGIAAVLASRSIRSAATTAATTTAREADEQRKLRTQLFTDAIQAVRSSLTEADILKAATEASRRAIGSDRVVVYAFDENGLGTIVAESVAPGWPRAINSGIADPCFGSKYIEEYRKGRVKATNNIYNVGLTDCHLKQLEPYAVKANLAAPLIFGDKLLGLLIAHQCSGPRIWQQYEIDLFTQIATQVGFALDNARFQQETNAEARLTEAFTDTVARIRGSLSEKDVLEVSVAEVRKVLNCDRVVIYSVDRESQGVITAESVVFGWPKTLGTTIKDPCFEAKYITKYQDGRIRALRDIRAAGMTPCYVNQLELLSVRANLVAPVVCNGTLLGLLVAHQCSGPRDWQQYEIKWFKQVAAQVGFALDESRLLDERASLQAEVDAEIQWKGYYEEATRSIHTSFEKNDILKAAVEESRRVLACNRVVVYSLDRQSQGVIIAESVAPGWPKTLGITIKDPCFEQRYMAQYENGRVRALSNIREARMTQCYVEQLESIAVKANLVAPVIHEGKLLGLLVAHQCSAPREWKELEIQWFKQVAIQVGYALDNAKLVGRVVQMSQEAETRSSQWHQKVEELQHRLTESLRSSETTVANLAREVQGQAEALTVTLDRIQALADSARGMETSAQQVEQQVQKARRTVEVGHESVNQTIDSLATIHETVAEAVAKVRHLGQYSQQALQLVTFIDELAVKMNEQSMAVTIESGRTNGGGQGSMVVVTEAVRSLTQQLTGVTAKIAPIMAAIDAEANDVAAEMEIGVQQALSGTERVKTIREQLNQVETIGTKMNAIVGKIAQSANNQGQFSLSTRQAILEISSLANRVSESSAAVAESLSQSFGIVDDF